MSSASNTNVGGMDSISIKKYLFRIAMKSEWENVVQAYRQNKKAHKARITKSGDTALHIAVLDGQQERVEELVNQLDSKEELNIQNDRGNTPLHFAAAQGDVRMCNCIAKGRPSLVGIRNKDGETPLFLAALEGKKDAFLCLHYICTPDKSRPNYSYCRRSDGETILHCAITGEYFDLAFHIIALYKELVYTVNQVGFSPLHLLASKPSCFMSGSHLIGPAWTTIIYHCISVDELNVEEADHSHERITNTTKNEKDATYPENYKTCINFLLVFWNLAKAFVTPKEEDQTRGQKDSTDPENPEEITARNSGPYNICFDFFKLLSKALMFLLGLGSSEIKKIRNQKEKHKWAVQIMDKLLESDFTYEYEDDGVEPSSIFDDETMPFKISDGGDSNTFGSLEYVWTSDHPGTSDPLQNDNKGNNSKEKKGEGPMIPKAKEIKPVIETYQKKIPDTEKKETPILIAVKNAATEMVEKILELFPVAKEKTPEIEKNSKETPILIAAKKGVTEMVEKILELTPVAIHDMNAEKKNIVLLAVENRQPQVYRLLLKCKFTMKESVFSKVDKDGNTALHLAAKLGEYKPGLKSGAALQMQWEIKWYEEVEDTVPVSCHRYRNADNLTARELFHMSHAKLMVEAEKSMKEIASSCTIIGALIVTIMFTAAFTLPGGNNGSTGFPTFIEENLFLVFIASDTLSLVSSTTSVIIFVGILMSRYSEEDFLKDLPTKMMIGLFTLFIAITTMMMAFFCGLNIMLHEKYSWIAIPGILVASIPIIPFMWMLFPLLVQTLISTYGDGIFNKEV